MEKKSKLPIVALCVALAAVIIGVGVFMTGGGQASAVKPGSNLALPGVATPGVLVVGLDDTFAPMGFRDDAGELTGFDIELARAVGEDLGLTVVFQPIAWDAKEMELQTMKIDCIWNGMSRTAEREAAMTLTKNYLNNRLIIMTPKTVQIDELAQLAQYEIGTQAGSSGLDSIKRSDVYEQVKDKVREYKSYDEALLDLQAGRIQALVVDEVLGNYKNTLLKDAYAVAKVNFGGDYYTIGFRRNANNADNEALVKAVEDAIGRIAASGKGEEISRKWFGTNLLLDTRE